MTDQGTFDLYDEIPLTLADDPEIWLGDLLTVAPVGRRESRHCRSDQWCSGTHELVDEGMFGPRGARFKRWLCPECGTSWADGSGGIVFH
jgi:hypothetical protein